MTKTQQQYVVPNLKSLATGAPRKWDERITPEGTWDLWSTEKDKAPWLAHVAVLEDGGVLGMNTKQKDAVRAFSEHPCVGFVGVVWTNETKTAIQTFTKQLRVSRGAGARLNQVVEDLGKKLASGLADYSA